MALQALRQQYTDIPKLVGLLTRLFGKGNFRVDVREKKISSLPPPPPFSRVRPDRTIFV
jgi:hypothetical protein